MYIFIAVFVLVGVIGRLHRLVDWTQGCVAVTEPEIDELYRTVKTGAVIEVKE
jgi:hypothetical protein